MQSKINLLHLITGLSCGGAEKMVYQLCKYSDKTQFDISVVSIDDTDYFLSKLMKLQIKVLKLGLKKNPIALLKGIFSLNKIIRHHKIQLIHAHLFHAMAIACIMKILNPKVKILWTSHSSILDSDIRSFIAYCSRLFRSRDIILQSHLKSWYNTIAFSVIPNGLELPLQSKVYLKFPIFTFISVGSLTKVKNHIFLINLFSKIDSFDFNLLIVGSGPEERKIQNRINELGLSTSIKLLGHRDNVFTLMNKSHCFLLPSLWEGLPLVVLESAYLKLPIITSSIISMKNLISEDEGYVVPFNQFEKAIHSVIDDYVEAEEKANRFYERAKNEFNILTCTRKHEQLYRSILDA